MSKHTAPVVTLEDARAWEVELGHPNVQYQYSVITRGPGRPMSARVAVVWVAAPGVHFTLFHDGELVQSARIDLVTGAWIRALARLHSSLSPSIVESAIALARWNLDGKLPQIRG
jgi:hypothetical protein